MYRCFDKQLNRALALVENIDKKWPYIEKQLLTTRFTIDDFGRVDDTQSNVGLWGKMLSGYVAAVRTEMGDPAKRGFVYKIDPALSPSAQGGSFNRYHSVVDAAAKSGVPREERPPTRLEYVKEYFKRYLVTADPAAAASRGRKTPFVNDIVRWLLSGTITFPEDIQQIRDLLKKYTIQKHNFGAKIPDLGTFDDPAELRKLLFKYEETQAYGALGHKMLPSIVPGIDVFRLDTYEEAQDVLCDSGWCVKDPEFFEQYEKPLYLFVKRPGGTYKRAALFSPGGGEFNDVYNQAMPPQELAEFAPIIDHIITNDYLRGHGLQRFSRTGSLPADLLSLVAPIIHLMPETVRILDVEALAEMAVEIIWPSWGRHTNAIVDRWPKYIEQKLRRAPKQYLMYVDAIAGKKRAPEFEPELIELGYAMYNTDMEYVAMLVEYFGKRLEYFGVGHTPDPRLNPDWRPDAWPMLTELLYEIRKDPELTDELYRSLRMAKQPAMTGFLYLVGNDWHNSDLYTRSHKRHEEPLTR